MQTVRRPWRVHLLVILAYTLLALALTWPLAARFGSHVPGNGADDPPLTWNLWWVRHALLDQATKPFDCDYLFYPLGINLAFYTLTVLNGLLSIPLQAVLGLVAASNVLLLSSFVLSGYGAFLLAGYVLSTYRKPEAAADGPDARHRLLAAFVAGLLYAFASSKLFYAALGQWNIASSQWIPFYILYLLRMGDEPRRRRYLSLATLFLLFQAYAELTYASFLVLFTALWGLWHLATRRWLVQRTWRPVANLLLVGILFAVGLLPILMMMVPDMLVEGDLFVEGTGFADVFSADLVGFLVPTMHHPLLGWLVDRFDFDYSVGQHLYLGYSVLILASMGALAWWRRPTPSQTTANAGRPDQRRTEVKRYPVRFWVASALVFWLLTLGPTLRVNGHDTGLPLPYALVAQLPFFKGNRYPSRYSVVLVLSLAILLSFGLYWLFGKGLGEKGQGTGRSPARRNLLPGTLSILLTAVLLFEHLSVPLPLSDMRVPAVYETIAEMPGDVTVLDLPVAWRNGFRVTGTQHPIIMFEQYYQTTHGKRILAGNTSRNPPLKFQYFTEAPVINTLIALETGHQVDAAVVRRDQVLAADVLRFFDVAAILVHPEETGPYMVPYVETTMPVERLYEGEEIVAYRVDLSPWPETWTIEPGDSLSRLSYAEGWGVTETGTIWAQRRRVRLLVPLNGQAQQMTFRAYTPAEGQQLRVEANGRTANRADMGRVTMAAGWADYAVVLPAEAVHAGLNEVVLRFETLFPAIEVRLSPGTLGQVGGVDPPANLVVQSAGQEVGDFGHIYVDGREVSPNERGYNVAVIDPQSGEVEQAMAFDTHLDAGASQALAAFLRDVPPGKIVAVAAADEASRLLGEEAVDALRGIGADGDLREKYRWGHAILGVQGAAPGTAREVLDWMRPVTVVAGAGATEPHLTAAFGPITFAAMPDR